MDISQMRTDYDRGPLRREDLHPSPFEQFRVWFEEACQSGLPDPNAMSLATVGADGVPSLRMVLLKKWDERGFVFFTNLESRKAQQIAANPNVALCFFWVNLARQVIITGRAEKLPTSEVVAYFATRPFGSQLAAWVSPQSRVISSRSLLEMKWEEMKRKFREGRVPLPSFWGGYRVVPSSLEFWQGRPSRLHDRFLYTPCDAEPSGWKIERLAP